MSLWEIIRNLKFKEIFSLSGIFLKNPRYFIPTLKATLETIKVCDFKFGDQHHLDNPTNAFRHAYWNYLICVKCIRITGSEMEVASWAKKITDLHEDLSPNEALAREMDLHNNRIGREIFFNNAQGVTDPVKFFKKLMAEAIHVSSIEEIRNAACQLVYIEN